MVLQETIHSCSLFHRGEEADEEDERERIGEERDCENEWNDGVVVDAEVGEVLADAEGGFGEGLGLRERGAVPELRPRAALVEAVSEGRGEVVDEGAEGRVVRRSLDGAAACGGGLGVGYGKDGSRGGGHDSFRERKPEREGFLWVEREREC